MSDAQLVNDVTQQHPAADPVMQETDYRPPHQEAESPSSVSFDQLIRCVHLYYGKFRAVEAAYSQIRAVLNGEQDPPIITLPTGETDEDGNQIFYELDLKQTLPERVPEDERLAALRIQLGPWNNYFCKEYRKWISQLARATASAAEQLESEGNQQRQQAPQSVPGRRVIQAPQVPPS